MDSWERFYRALKRINLALGVLAGVIVIIASIITTYDVVMRYGFSEPTTWAGEAACFLMVYVVFLGLGLALQDGSHVSVELFLELIEGRANWILRLIGAIIVLIFGLIFTWQTAAVAYDSWRYNWVSSSMLAMPLKYVYLVGPLGCLLFTLTSVFLLVRHIKSRSSNDSSE